MNTVTEQKPTTSAAKRPRTPKKLWEVSKLMMKLASVVFSELRIRHCYNLEMSRLEAERDAKLEALGATRQALLATILEFMNSRRAEVEAGGTKSVALATGEVGWRERKPSVEVVGDLSEDDVVKILLARRGGKRFLYPTWKIDKSVVLERGRQGHRLPRELRIKTGEQFFISLSPRGGKRPKVISRDL